MKARTSQQYTYQVSVNPIDFEANSLQEVAKQLNVTLSTVHTLVHATETEKKLGIAKFVNIKRVKKNSKIPLIDYGGLIKI
jgi:transposase